MDTDADGEMCICRNGMMMKLNAVIGRYSNETILDLN